MKRELIHRYMTPMPHSIGARQTLDAAHRMMREHSIRHLPVLEAGKLVGVVSIGDLHLVETLQGADPTKISIEEAMSPEVYRVPPHEPLATVCAVMAKRKLGCAVVMDGENLAGVFTAVDALRTLAIFLEEPASEPVAPKRRSAPTREARANRQRHGAAAVPTKPAGAPPHGGRAV